MPLGRLGIGDRTKSRDAPDLSGAIRERPGLREAGQPRTAPRTNPTPTAAARSELWQLGNLAGQSPGPSGDPAERPGPRKAPSEQPHTWLANARRCGVFRAARPLIGLLALARAPCGQRP